MRVTIVLVALLSLAVCQISLEQDMLNVIDEDDQLTTLKDLIDTDYDRLVGDMTRTGDILGGDTDPDHQSHDTIQGGDTDPDMNLAAHPEREFDPSAEFPREFAGEDRAKQGDFIPRRGKNIAKQRQKVISPYQDIVRSAEPCNTEASPPAPDQSEICSSTECVEYEVVPLPAGTCGFELRKYNRGYWIMKKSLDMRASMPPVSNKAFEPLMNYLSGANSKQLEMKLTLPKMTIYDQLDDWENLQQNQDRLRVKRAYTALPVVTTTTQYKPPLPNTNNGVFPEELFVEDGSAFVRVFGGENPSFEDYMWELEMLKESIRRAELKADFRTFFVQEFDSQRHEVGYFAEKPEIS